LTSEETSVIKAEVQRGRVRETLDRPLSRLWCAVSWVASTGLFVIIVQLLGGIAPGDSAESVYSTWSIAHLNMACAYPPASHFHFSPDALPFVSVAPLYPFLSAVASATLRIGHSVAFPTTAAMGAHCSNASVAIYRWSISSHALNPTLKIAYLGWMVLMASVVVLLRTSGRGRNGWEAATLSLLAIAPPVYMCVATYFHPQDLVAMGCILFAVSCAIRGRWLWAGVLLGLAFTSQQFALLAIALMIVIVPGNRRLSLFVGTVLSIGIVDGPFILLTSGRALKTALFGSSRLTVFGANHFHATGGTVLFATHLHGAALFLVARVLPVLCALAIALWVARRLGPRVTEIETLLSLLATALCMRLVFEENLFGYYFMALAVSLLCIEALRGRLSGRVFVWMGMVMLAFNPIPWWLYLRWEARGLNLYLALPVLFEVIVLSAFLVGARHRRYRWYLVASSIVVALTCFPPLWGRVWTPHVAPFWLWQIILVPTGLMLASESLRFAIRNHQSGLPLEVADPIS
jgi:hypothetical protein